ncbi:hypothetical protein [Oscillatoria sp. FACHB-1406]|uniref:hypothetical protein n=1 Tax=Oscillatoria sp. FACHB-1406 TaxID=2692846 RepID=UPI001689107B|nr:hypothetical protein [Oscillatoria sp. FACHB-1406]MBD2576128.1 hypothetical protein [Oscillatoria sp. FACHB-1406]
MRVISYLHLFGSERHSKKGLRFDSGSSLVWKIFALVRYCLQFGGRYSKLMKFVLLLAVTFAAFSVDLQVAPKVLGETTSSGSEITASALEANEAFGEGYEVGYRMGLNRGFESRSANTDYLPEILGIGGEFGDEIDRRASAGFQAGFQAGFHEGYYARDANTSRAEIERFNDGYSRGYERGFEDALLCRQVRDCAYAPKPVPDRLNDAQYQSGYQLGYWQAFEKGWTSDSNAGRF